MEKKVVSKIKKLLALSDKAGTEAEAFSAMSKAHELLARHGLSLGDIEMADDRQEEEYEQQEKIEDVGLRPWKRLIWSGLAELYFCQYYYIGTRRHFLIGKSSNIEICKYLIQYIINVGEKLAAEGVADAALKRGYKTSFKAGFGNRIYRRCKTEIENAKNHGIKDSSTGNMLIVHPLYEKARAELEEVKKDLGLKFRSHATTSTVRHAAGWYEGQEAANKVSLSSSSLSGIQVAKQIASG